MKKIYMLLIICLTISLLTSCNTLNNFSKNEHSKEWILDLEVIKENVPNRAIAFYEFITKDEWEENINSLIDDINSKAMSDEEINYRISEILTKVNNGHTFFQCDYEINNSFFPIALWPNSNKEYYLCSTSKEFEKYLGAKLVSINNLKMEKVADLLLKIIPHDNPIQIDSLLESSYLNVSSLDYLGITNKENIFTFEMPNGDIEKIQINPINPINMEELVDMSYIAHQYKNLPLKFQRPADMLYEYWYKIDESNRVFYFQYNSCEEKGYKLTDKTYLPVFTEFSNKMINYMKDNDSKFDTIIVDVRKNTGGNSGLFSDLVTTNLDYLNTKKMKVLTDKVTFSAGMAVINTLYEHFNVKSYGTETGGLIGGYTEIQYIVLKNTNSKIYFSTEITGYDTLQKRQHDEFVGFIPDKIVEDSVDDFINGIDRVYESAVNDK